MTMDFDGFITQLIEESKAFYERAKKTSESIEKEAYLHSSLLLAMSSLEACINAIVEEILIEPYRNHYDILEQSLLLERDISFKNGHYQLGKGLKISRVTERIEFLIYKYSGKELPQDENWYVMLKQSLDFRNKLVHPKEYIKITEKQVENAINAVLDTMNKLYLVIYKRKFPAYDMGITSKYDIF